MPYSVDTAFSHIDYCFDIPFARPGIHHEEVEYLSIPFGDKGGARTHAPCYRPKALAVPPLNQLEYLIIYTKTVKRSSNQKI